MRKITSKEIQKLELDILKEFKQFALKNDIQYFLCGGTLLGAIRHKGFIPWDDDIDIFVPRQSYDKIMTILQNNRFLDDEKTYKVYFPLDENYIYPYIKVVNEKTIVYEKDIKRKYCLGVWVDVFPLDEWPDSIEEQQKLLKNHSKYKFFNKIYVAGHLSTLSKKIIAAIGKIGYAILCFGKDNKYWVEKMLSQIQPYHSHLVGNLSWPNRDKDIFSKEIFKNSIECQFEDDTFPIPVGYKEYLTNMYGDYMQLPKEKDRVFHDFEGYYLDN